MTHQIWLRNSLVDQEKPGEGYHQKHQPCPKVRFDSVLVRRHYDSGYTRLGWL